MIVHLFNFYSVIINPDLYNCPLLSGGMYRIGCFLYHAYCRLYEFLQYLLFLWRDNSITASYLPLSNYDTMCFQYFFILGCRNVPWWIYDNTVNCNWGFCDLRSSGITMLTNDILKRACIRLAYSQLMVIKLWLE